MTVALQIQRCHADCFATDTAESWTLLAPPDAIYSHIAKMFDI